VKIKKTKQIKVSLETAKRLDAIRGQETQLTYDAAIQALLQAQALLRLLGQQPSTISEK